MARSMALFPLPPYSVRRRGRSRVHARRRTANNLPDPHLFFQLAFCIVQAWPSSLFGEALARLLVGKPFLKAAGLGTHSLFFPSSLMHTYKRCMFTLGSSLRLACQQHIQPAPTRTRYAAIRSGRVKAASKYSQNSKAAMSSARLSYTVAMACIIMAVGVDAETSITAQRTREQTT
eukprot:scaffold56526_cov19-Tisochrysis_lutea.AAC.1